MATPFLRSLRSVEGDGFRGALAGLLVAAAVLGAWTVWMLSGRVARYEVSDDARLEVNRAIHVLQSPLLGRVVASRLELDAEVRAGDILVELDSNPEQLQLEEEQTRLRALAPQIDSLQGEIQAIEQAREQERQATVVALEEARARFREAEALGRSAETEAGRLERLHSQGLIPQRDLDQGQAEAERRRAASESLRLVAGRLEQEQRTRDIDREARLRGLGGEISRLEGLRSTAAAAIERLRYEIERRKIRAPVDGRLGEVAVLRIGAVVGEGEKLGAIVPAGTLRVIAQFPPPAALGRIRPGQPARLRLHGFPWVQYGSIAARVESVASEIREGRVRVELRVAPRQSTPIPLQHGLPGSVEVEVERVTPATLALRAAGQWIATTVSPYPK